MQHDLFWKINQIYSYATKYCADRNCAYMSTDLSPSEDEIRIKPMMCDITDIRPEITNNIDNIS